MQFATLWYPLPLRASVDMIARVDPSFGRMFGRMPRSNVRVKVELNGPSWPGPACRRTLVSGPHRPAANA